MMAYAIDNPAPCTIVLITGDRDFSYAMSILKLRRYRIVLITLPNAHASLTFQACICFDWFNDVVDQEGSRNSLMQRHQQSVHRDAETTRLSLHAIGVDATRSNEEEGIDSIRYFHDPQMPSNDFPTSRIRQDVSTSTATNSREAFLPSRISFTHSTKVHRHTPDVAHGRNNIQRNYHAVDEQKAAINSEQAYDKELLEDTNATLNGLNFEDTPTQHIFSSSKSGMDMAKCHCSIFA